MAELFPSLEKIKNLKVKPTEGELYLLTYLQNNLSDDIEVYFQPYIQGDRPDIILLQKNVGVTIIEVKDWNLDAYYIDERNEWHLKNHTKKQKIKSPLAQVFTYKKNLFDIHINGLLEERLKNPSFYNRINVYVYFHKASKKDIDRFYNPLIEEYRKKMNQLNEKLNNEEIDYETYDRNWEYLKLRKHKIERDKKLLIGYDDLKKIALPKEDKNILFKDSIYKEFKRYLQPPYHSLNQGIEITYTSEQKKVIESKVGYEKIKGVAGSGKTTVLAKRAVNAHKRHGDKVLILTYNISLINYIHDKISEVRENFDWRCFHIINYHQFIKDTMNNIGMAIEIPNEYDDKEIEEYLEEKYFSNVDLFDGYENEIHKYKSIFIDEIQDYKPEWVKIIEKYFLESENSEMVLFGDEKQDIYNRKTAKRDITLKGFGRWKILKKSMRYHENNRILNLAKNFQLTFFKDKYGLDDIKLNPSSLALGLYHIGHYEKNKIEKLTENIYKQIREFNIHPNDIAIMASHKEILREIDYFIRKKYNEKALTTFETQEYYDKLLKNKKSYEIEKIEKNKKRHFYLNPGVVKLATIHSFKGFEIPTLFLIIDEEDNEEMIYTGITRSKFNIMVFTSKDSKYNEFFYKNNLVKVEN